MEMTKPLRISMQFFAEGGAGDGGNTGGAGSAGDSGSTGGNAAGDEPGNQGKEGNADGKGNTNPDIERLVQARADKLTAESGKKIAALQKELEKLKKEKMTDDELKQFEMTEKERTLAERERALADKENRLIAIKAIKEAGLDDGSENALELVDFVMADDEEAVRTKVKAFGALVNKFVAAKVDKTFRQNGRNPNGGSSGNEGGDNNAGTSVAEMLGKNRAEQQKRSREILDKFTRR